MGGKKRFGLLPRVLVAIVAGIACSLFFPGWAVRIFLTINSIFGNFLGLFIPVLIIGLIAPGIADLGGKAGRLLLVTVALAYVSTVLSGTLTFFTCQWIYPPLLGGMNISETSFDMSVTLTPFFTIEMPPFISVTSALVLAFAIGLASAAIKEKTGVLTNLREIVFLIINKAIIPVLPLYIFGIFLQMGAEGKVVTVLSIFGKVIAVILALHILVLLLQFCTAGIVARKNPLKALKGMLPAYTTALGTQSSAATIPVTLRCAKSIGVSDGVADFTVPMCATIHLSCSVLKITACAYAISLVSGLDVSAARFIGFVFMLSITMVAAPGVPGGAIMASLGLLASMLGFDADQQGLMIAIYIALDSFGTAGNVTGDGAISLIVDTLALRWGGKRSTPEITENNQI